MGKFQQQQQRPARIRIGAIIGIIIAVAALSLGALGLWQYQKNRLTAGALAEGKRAFEAGDWNIAAQQLGRYIGRNQQDTEALLMYARAQRRINPLAGSNLGQATAAYRKVLRTAPTEALKRELAALLRVSGQFDELAHFAESIAPPTSDPTEVRSSEQAAGILWLAEATLVMQRSANETGAQMQRLETLITTLEPTPGSADVVPACVLLARANLQGTPNPQAALEIIERGLAYDPEAAELLLLRCIVQRGQSASGGKAENDAAIEDLERAARSPRSTAGILLSIADEFMTLGQTDRTTALLAELGTRTPADTWNEFADFDQWRAALYSVRARLGLRSEFARDLTELVGSTGTLLKELKSRSARITVLPAAIQVYASAEKIDEARKALEELDETLKLVDAGPGRTERLALLKAIVARAENNFTEVIQLLAPLAERPGAAELVRQMLLEAWVRTNNFEKAKPAVDELAQRSDASIETLVLAATLAGRQGQIERQLEIAQRGLEREPGNIELGMLDIEGRISRVGRATATAQELQKLVHDAEQLAESEPRPKTVTLRAVAHEVAKQPEKAEIALLEGIRSFPDSIELKLQHARFLARANRADDARSALAAARSKHATKPIIWLESADLAISGGDTAGALQLLEEALKNVPSEDAEQICIATAVLEIRSGKEESAALRLRKACETYPTSIAVRVMLVSMPSIARNANEAGELIEQIRKLEGPDGTAWRIQKAVRLLDAADWDKSFDGGDNTSNIRAMLEFCLREDPGAAQAALLLGKALESYGKTPDAAAKAQADAEAVYRKSLDTRPTPVVAEALLRLYEKQRRFDDAQKLIADLKPVLGSTASGSRSAAIALASGDVGQALSDLRAKIEASGKGAAGAEDATSLLSLARLTYVEQRSSAKAFGILDRALAAGAAPLAVAAAKVQILMMEQRPDEAMAVADALVAQSGDDVDIRIFRGRMAIGQKDFAKAEEDFQAAVGNSNSGIGEMYLGELYMKLERTDEAIDTWRRGLERNKNNDDLRRGLAKALINRGKPEDLDAAEQYARELEERNPNDVDAVWIQAVIAVQATPQREDALRRLLARALSARGERPEAYRGLARIALQINEPKTALNILLRGVALNPGAFDLLALLASVSFECGDEAGAIKAVRLAIDRASMDPQNYIFALDALMRVRDEAVLEELRKHLATIQRRQPESDLCVRMLAHTMHLQGRESEAIEELNRFRRDFPNAGTVAVLLALEDYYRIAKADAKADEALRQATELAPDSPGVGRAQLVKLHRERQLQALEQRATELAARDDAGLLGVAADLLRRLEGGLPSAAAAYRKLAELNPTSADAQAKLADTLMAMKDYEGAETAFADAVKRSTIDDASILNNYAWLLARYRAKFTEAEPLSRRAVAVRPDNPDMLDTLAYILTHSPQKGQAQREEAERLYTRCIELLPADAPGRTLAYLNLAEVCNEMGKVERAKELATEASNLERARPTLEPEDRARLEKLMAQFPTP